MKIKVLYEDNHLIAVEKPAGVLVQGDKSKDTTLYTEVKAYFKDKYKKPGNVFLGIIHRLDRPVSGIVLFAKTSKGASRLSEQLRDKTFQKKYYALVIGKPKSPEGKIASYLIKDKEKNKSEVLNSPAQGARYAELFYKTIRQNAEYSLLEIETKTGRSHQIRAQLSSINCPIVGDVKYGAPFPLKDKSICLCAAKLSFKKATGEGKINLSLPLPKTWKEMPPEVGPPSV